MASRKALCALLAAAALVGTTSAQYTVQWVYANDACSNPAVQGVFMNIGSCVAVPCNDGAPGDSHWSKVTCANSVGDIIGQGGNGKYLVAQYYTSASCSGSAESGVFYETDVCRPAGGAIQSYQYFTCSGGNAVVKSCTDDGCSNCETASFPVNDCTHSDTGTYATYLCSAASSAAASMPALVVAVAATVLAAAF